MIPTVEATEPARTAPADLVEAIRAVLAAQDEPLTPAKIKAALPAPFRAASPEELSDCLQRQVVAQVLHAYPKYRGSHDRFWDRPMPVHVAVLLRGVLSAEPLPLFEIRRRLPSYAMPFVEEVLREALQRQTLHRHAPPSKRGSERFGVTPADPKTYLRLELTGLLSKIEELGFSRTQVRAAALELLQDEEWSAPPASASAEPAVPARDWSYHTEETPAAPHAFAEPARPHPAPPATTSEPV